MVLTLDAKGFGILALSLSQNESHRVLSSWVPQYPAPVRPTLKNMVSQFQMETISDEMPR